MRRLAALALLLTGCATTAPPGDAWFGPDKAKHFLAGAAFGAAGALAATSADADDGAAVAAGVGAAAAAGAGKEWYDVEVSKTGWSWKDLVWDLLGGCAGATAAAAFSD
jgi:putative lipoprotein